MHYPDGEPALSPRRALTLHALFESAAKHIQRYFEVGEPVVVDHSHPYHGGRTGMVTKVGTRATDDETCARSLQ